MTIIQARASVHIAIEAGTRREIQTRRFLLHSAVGLRRDGGFRLAHLVFIGARTQPIRCPSSRASPWSTTTSRVLSIYCKSIDLCLSAKFPCQKYLTRNISMSKMFSDEKKSSSIYFKLFQILMQSLATGNYSRAFSVWHLPRVRKSMNSSLLINLRLLFIYTILGISNFTSLFIFPLRLYYFIGRW